MLATRRGGATSEGEDLWYLPLLRKLRKDKCRQVPDSPGEQDTSEIIKIMCLEDMCPVHI